jgi:hypothetical protein
LCSGTTLIKAFETAVVRFGETKLLSYFSSVNGKLRDKREILILRQKSWKEFTDIAIDL